MVGQLVWPGADRPWSGAVRGPDLVFADTGPGPARRITYPTLNERVRGVTIDPRAVPIDGSPDAPVVTLLASDATCAYCGLMHRMAAALRDRHGERVAVIHLPVARRSTPEAGPLRDASLAVWLIDPAAWVGFNDWLYAPDPPAFRDPAAARAYAATLVDPAALDEMLASDALRETADRFQAVHDLIAGTSYPAFVIERVLVPGSAVNDATQIDAFLDFLDGVTTLGEHAGAGGE